MAMTATATAAYVIVADSPTSSVTDWVVVTVWAGAVVVAVVVIGACVVVKVVADVVVTVEVIEDVTVVVVL